MIPLRSNTTLLSPAAQSGTALQHDDPEYAAQFNKAWRDRLRSLLLEGSGVEDSQQQQQPVPSSWHALTRNRVLTPEEAERARRRDEMLQLESEVQCLQKELTLERAVPKAPQSPALSPPPPPMPTTTTTTMMVPSTRSPSNEVRYRGTSQSRNNGINHSPLSHSPEFNPHQNHKYNSLGRIDVAPLEALAAEATEGFVTPHHLLSALDNLETLLRRRTSSSRASSSSVSASMPSHPSSSRIVLPQPQRVGAGTIVRGAQTFNPPQQQMQHQQEQQQHPVKQHPVQQH
eukprot:PhM_4_TR11925/c0_g1_i1/m.72591